MSHFKKILPLIILGFLVSISSASAQDTAIIDAIKGKINSVVVDVRDADTPEEKKEILASHFERLHRNIPRAQVLIDDEALFEALDTLSETITRYQGTLDGLGDADVVDLAESYQQEMETASLGVWIVVAIILWAVFD